MYFQNNFMSLQILPPDSMSRIIDKHFEFSQTLHFSIKESLESQICSLYFISANNILSNFPRIHIEQER